MWDEQTRGQGREGGGLCNTTTATTQHNVLCYIALFVLCYVVLYCRDLAHASGADCKTVVEAMRASHSVTFVTPNAAEPCAMGRTVRDDDDEEDTGKGRVFRDLW